MGRHRRSTWWLRWPVTLAVVLVLVIGVGYIGIRVIRSTQASPVGCPGESRTVRLGVAPEAADWIGQLVTSYNMAHRMVSGLCAQIAVSALPLDQAEQVLQATPPTGQTPPEIWIPESRLSIDLLRDRPSNKAVLPATAPSIASSPMVLAAPADALDAIKSPAGSPLQISDYLNLAENPKGWGQLNHPDWGPVRFCTADPDGSTTGVGLIQSVVATAAGIPLDKITDSTYLMPSVQTGLQKFVPTLTRTPADASQFFDGVQNLTSSIEILKSYGLIAAIEQQVYQYNTIGGQVPLKAVYPFGGAFAADFPVVSVNGSWVDGFGHSVAADFTGWARAAGQQATLAQYGLRRVDGTVGTLDTADKGLSRSTQAPVRSTPTSAASARGLWNLVSKPNSVLEVVDTSASMANTVPGTGQSRLEVASAAGLSTLNFFQASDHLGLWEFSLRLDGMNDYRNVVPLGALSDPAGGRSRLDALRAGYGGLQPHTSGGLYDTVLAAYRYAQTNYRPNALNCVLLITDGPNQDNQGISLADLLSQLSRQQNPAQPVHLITIGLGNQVDPTILSQISAAADGLSFVSSDLSNITQLFLTAEITLAP